MQAFIDRELGLAQQNPRDAFFHLGRALHPIMDSTSPLHEGFQEWSINKHPFESRRHGDGPYEGPSALTQQRLRQTERAVQTYAPNLADLCKVY